MEKTCACLSPEHGRDADALSSEIVQPAWASGGGDRMARGGELIPSPPVNIMPSETIPEGNEGGPFLTQSIHASGTTAAIP